ncbi:alpha/beta hydrolase [Arthrobacter sp. SDTb3-6]|uniref:alpha/beta hydrolase n=1 Tax=Arthrobacter sp. SDTb3-6 TaxID=2713571 RepID=UPI003526316A
MPPTKDGASQAAAGLVVVNANYRKAPRFNLGHVLQDANAALAWVAGNIARLGGDPPRVVLGGDWAGSQISAPITAATFRPSPAGCDRLQPGLPAASLTGLVQHCSVADPFRLFRSGIRAEPELHPHAHARAGDRQGQDAPARGGRLHVAHRMAGGPLPAGVHHHAGTGLFYTANLNLIASLQRHGVEVDPFVYGWESANTEHTWQQNFRFPEVPGSVPAPTILCREGGTPNTDELLDAGLPDLNWAPLGPEFARSTFDAPSGALAAI